MNYVSRSMTFTVMLILFGIHAVSHSQYYPATSFRSSSPFEQGTTTRNDQYNYFNSRNLQPSYRQHQHSFHFSNDPLTTVQYYGTQSSNVDNFQPDQSASVAEYRVTPRRRYYSSPTTAVVYPEYSPTYEFDNRNIENRNYFRDASRETERPRYLGGVQSRSFQVDQQNQNRNKYYYPEVETSSIEKPPGTIVIMIQISTCNGSSRIYRKNGHCYTLGVRKGNPCGTNMQLYAEENNEIYAECDCAPDIDNALRPIAWWRAHDACYPLYSRGPCGYNEWFILDGGGRPTCAPRKCPRSDFAGGDSEFWFLYKGRCYKTGNYYPQFCKPGQEEYKAWFGPHAYKPSCFKDRPDSEPKIRHFLTPLGDLKCRAGYKRMQNGECKRTTKFDYDY